MNDILWGIAIMFTFAALVVLALWGLNEWMAEWHPS